MAKELVNIAELVRWLNKAESGSTKSVRTRFLNKLKRIEEKWRVTANSRIRRLQRAGFGNIQDLAAAHFTTFKSVRNKTPEQIYAQVVAERKVLTGNTTLRLARKAELEALQAIRKESEKFEDWSDDKVKDFWNWIGRTSLQDYLDFVPDSYQALENLQMIWDTESYKTKVNDLIEEYDEYKQKLDEGVPEILITKGMSGTDFVDAVERLSRELYDKYESIRTRRR